MAIEHHFYLGLAATHHELRDALVRAGTGFEVVPDWKNTSGASSAATNVVIRDDQDCTLRPDNGVMTTRSVMFGDRKAYLSRPEFEGVLESQTIQGTRIRITLPIREAGVADGGIPG